MPAVLFLHGANDRLQAAAAWLAARSTSPGRTLVFHPDPDQLGMLDRLLWTASATGFTPHCRVSDRLAEETPILLTSTLQAVPSADCLLNLSDEVPADMGRFDEVVELISTDDAIRLPGRERFRHYRNCGYSVTSIDIAEGVPG